MKFAIACAMVLAFFSPSAAASDDRELALVSAPVPVLAAAPTAVSTTAVAAAPVSTSASAPAKTLAALPNAPSPTEPTPTELTTIAVTAPPAAIITLKRAPTTHSFFDARNSMGFASMAASLTADALSTQKGLSYPGFREMNPIARPFVQTRAGAVAYNAGSFGLLAGTMYLAHKTQHHKLEHILPFAVAGWEGLLSFRNYRVIANRPR